MNKLIITATLAMMMVGAKAQVVKPVRVRYTVPLTFAEP